jgi:beta-carotene hydroxylase
LSALTQAEQALDRQALEAAQQRMGEFAWRTVLLGLAVAVAYLATVATVTSGALPLAGGTLLIALLTYLAYTVLHEAVHGSICGSHRQLRWVNEAMGYLAGWIVMIPMTAHRHEHLTHHRHTNEADADPDYLVAGLLRNPLRPLYAIVGIIFGQYRHYFKHRWGKGPRSQDVTFCLELIAGLGLRLGFMAQGFWLEGTVLFVVGGLGGVLVTMYLFAYIVHHPHTAVGRYANTSTIIVGGPVGTLTTWLWLYQNYHSIHHLFPRVPFYRYRELFDEIEDVMQQRGAPIYRLGAAGFRPSAA